MGLDKGEPPISSSPRPAAATPALSPHLSENQLAPGHLSTHRGEGGMRPEGESFSNYRYKKQVAGSVLSSRQAGSQASLLALNNHKKKRRNQTNRDGKHLIGRADNKALFFPPVGPSLWRRRRSCRATVAPLCCGDPSSCQTAAAGQSAAHLEGSGRACATSCAATHARTRPF